MTPTPQQFVALMNRIIHHSREIEAANAHDRGYVLGWRAATNTAIVALWAALNDNHDLPATNTAPEVLRRVSCKACRHVQFKSASDSTGCIVCGGFALSFFRRSTDIDAAAHPPLPMTTCTKCGHTCVSTPDGICGACALLDAPDNAHHDRECCDCMDCENWRRCEASHDAPSAEPSTAGILKPATTLKSTEPQ